ncbi:MAG: heavy metal translocating P-type ATPase [Rhodospirillaceae bacterium]
MPFDSPADDLSAFVRPGGDGTATLDLFVEGVHCAGCVRRIETALGGQPGVVAARLNLTDRVLRLGWRPGEAAAGELVAALTQLGYRAVPIESPDGADARGAEDRWLLRCLAVAGFAFGNIMLLSVSVWAGAFADMGPATRELFHWVSALIALPAVAYAGQPFFAAALASIKARRLGMDLPISVGVLLTAGMSLFETAAGGDHVYFDAAVSLLFFLLVGRVLDRHARSRANAAAERLVALAAATAHVVGEDGAARPVPIRAVRSGMTVAVAAGDRVPVDGLVLSGRSDVDTALVTGETLPQAVEPGARVFAGTLNLTGPLTLSVTGAGDGTLLAEIARLLAAAAQGRARYVRLADRIARLYSPLVHALALLTFFGWVALGGMGWQPALLIAVAVLIITCPCALGLAVPVVQVVASGRLFRRGILVKSADGLERLAQADTIVFDKTGTLTLGRPALVGRDALDAADLAFAASIAAASRHPLSRALVAAAGPTPALADVREVPGSGLAAPTPDGEAQLGSRAWCGVADDAPAAGPELWLARPGRAPVCFRFADALRFDAAETVAALHAAGYSTELLSGDRAEVVAAVAGTLGIARWQAAMTPGAKAARLAELAAVGRKVLMVGDGLNDAPALAAAFASMSPSTAADVSQTAADLVFQGDRLAAVLEAIGVARGARRLVLQNFALAFAYNALAVPLAVAGLVTPLVAAVAMSSSSLIVTLNALRLRAWRG